MIQRFLDEIGWSKARLARYLGVHPVTVSRWVKNPETMPAWLLRHMEVMRVLRQVGELVEGVVMKGRGKGGVSSP